MREKISQNVIKLLRAERYSQSELCRANNWNIYSFNTQINRHNLSIEMIEKAYAFCGVTFPPFRILTARLQEMYYDLDKRKQITEIMGVSPSKAKYAFLYNKVSWDTVNKVVAHNNEFRDLFAKYCR